MFRSLLVALVLAPVCVAADANPESVVGTKAPNLALTVVGDGTQSKLDALRGKAATVVVFVSFECPVSNSYVAGLNELARTHAEKGVAVVLVCPTDDPREAVAKAAAGFKLTVPVLLDPKRELASGLGAVCTPEAFLLDGEGTVRYRGRIDDGYSARLKRNPVVSTHELTDALNAVLAGKPVATAVTKSVGCEIEYAAKPASRAGAVTFYKDVAPILNAHCVVCHRTGEVGPFALTTFAQARRWARDIKEYTANKQMPPWPAAGGVPMRGERKMAAAEIAALAAWADADAPEGDPKDAPKAPEFGSDGWRHGKPDLVLTADADFRLGGSGSDLFRVFVVPTKLTANKWVIGYDVKPGNPRVVHHTLHYFDTTGAARGLEAKQRAKDDGKILLDSGPGYTVGMGVGFVPPANKPNETPQFGGIGGWAPGQLPQFVPQGAGWLLPKGSDFLIQTHYHRNGQFATDRTQVGLYFAKGPVEQPWQTLIINGLKQWEKIPAGRADFGTGGAIYLHTDAVLHNVLPHMHVLGKSVRVTMTPPGGQPVVLVEIPAWDYRWQETYWFKEPIAAKAGTKLEVRAVFDNSAANPNNPTKPPRDVAYGEETTDEMLFVFLGATSTATPWKPIKTFAYAPDAAAAPIKGELTPLLKELVGTWDTNTELKVGGRGVNLKGQDVVETAFNGTFLRSLATSAADDRGLIQLITYDPAAKRYRMWLYDSAGTEVEWTGTPDEAAKTIAWRAHTGDGTKLALNWKLAAAGGYTWDFVASTGDKTVFEMKGDHTARKK
ncbi:redoxin domain-containing protein [Gemmata sp.]|uniref:redoxin domain-containing protein n=1 Tax=Gemmata sp. TaxID=1914242 RepID=UPI003F709B13